MFQNFLRFPYHGFRAQHVAANFFFAFAAVLICQFASANPTGEKPTTPLKSHGTVGGASEMIGKLYGLLNSVESEIEQFRELEKTPGKVKPEKLQKTFANLWQAQRELDRLSGTGETALVDLAARTTSAHKAIAGFGARASSTPAGQKFHANILKKHAKETKSRQRLLMQATEAIKKGRGATVLRKLENEASEYYGDLICESFVTRGKKMRIFNDVLGGASQALQPAIVEKIQTSFQTAMSSDREIVDRTVSQIQRLTEGVRSTFPMEIGEQKVESATDLMRYAFSKIADGHAALQRLETRQRVLKGNRNEPNAGASKAFASEATEALAGLIGKLVQVSDPASAADLHRQLMVQVASYDHRLAAGLPRLSEVAAGTMDALTKKTPSMAESVSAYQRATQPVIAFRRQFVASQVKKLMGIGYRDCSEMLASKAPTPNGFRGASQAGKTLPDSIIADTKIATRLSWQVAEASARLVGKKVSDGPSYRLSPTSRTGVVAFGGQHYSNLSLSIDHQAQTANLKRLLLVDDQHGPLSSDAASLISAAELGDYFRVGGTIGRVHGESFATRFSTLPAVAAALVPIGGSPSVNYQGPVANALGWRVDLRPEWFATESFVVYASGSAGKVAVR